MNMFPCCITGNEELTAIVIWQKEYSMKLNRIRTVIISLSGILIQPRVWVLVAKVAPFLLLPTIFLYFT